MAQQISKGLARQVQVYRFARDPTEVLEALQGAFQLSHVAWPRNIVGPIVLAQ